MFKLEWIPLVLKPRLGTGWRRSLYGIICHPQQAIDADIYSINMHAYTHVHPVCVSVLMTSFSFILCRSRALYCVTRLKFLWRALSQTMKMNCNGISSSWGLKGVEFIRSWLEDAVKAGCISTHLTSIKRNIINDLLCLLNSIVSKFDVNCRGKVYIITYYISMLLNGRVFTSYVFV